MIVTDGKNAAPTCEDLYLGQLAILRAEINRAISAIANNDLVALDESNSAKEALCSRFKVLLQAIDRDLDTPSIQRLQVETSSILELTRTYLLLLKQAGVNSEQLYRLCQTYAA